MFTTASAPAGYAGPVRLNPAQVARTAQLQAQYIATLRRQAGDASDPEIQACALALLAEKGVTS